MYCLSYCSLLGVMSLTKSYVYQKYIKFIVISERTCLYIRKLRGMNLQHLYPAHAGKQFVMMDALSVEEQIKFAFYFTCTMYY